MAIIPQIITEDRASGAQVIDGSLKFDGDLAYYLTKTLSSVGNQRTFTFSCWCKRSRFGTHSSLFSSSGNGDFFKFAFRDDNRFEINTTDGGVDSTHLFSTAKFRDTNWYHIVIAFDTTQVTSTNRVKFYVNNTQITDFDLNTYPGQDVDTSVNDNVQHIIGNQVANTRYFDGMISNVYMIDGQQLDPSYFGYTDPLTNTWRPKKYNRTGGINDGRTWSSDMSGTSNSGVYTGMFDGSFTGYEQAVNSATLTYTPTGGLTANSSIRIYLQQSADTYASSADVTVNGSSIKTGAVNSTLGTGSAIGWVDIGTSLTTLTWSNPAGSNNDYRIFAIDVDGVMLIDGLNDPQVWGKNGFYLPFDGNTPIGKDQSGNNNDWTPVNFGGSNSTEKATGALPILNLSLIHI